MVPPYDAIRVNLKNVLCEIKPDRSNLHGGRLLCLNNTDVHLGTSMLEKGSSIPSDQLMEKERTGTF
jgi:hypothetical protein